MNEQKFIEEMLLNMNGQKFTEETLHTMLYFFENRKNKEISDLADEYFENDMKLDDFILKAQAIVDKLEYVETVVKKIYHGLNPSDRLYISCPKCGAFMTYDGELEECFCPVCDFHARVDTRLGIVRIDEKE